MNELIRFQKSGGVLSVEITVSTFLPWDYGYTEENVRTTYRSNSSEGKTMPHSYALGFANQMEFDFNSFEVNLFVDGQTEDFEIRIVWRQDGRVLHQWVRSGPTNAETPQVLNLPGSVRFLGQ